MFALDKDRLKDKKGIVYVLYLWHEDEIVVKIGVTGRRVEDRAVEILLSYFHSYRVFPKTYPRRFRKTEVMYEKEAMLHRYFGEYRYRFEKDFNGSTEFFSGIEEEELLGVYEDCMDGIDINGEDYVYGRSEEGK